MIMFPSDFQTLSRKLPPKYALALGGVWGDNRISMSVFAYSQVANRRGGRLLIFRNFPDPPEAY